MIGKYLKRNVSVGTVFKVPYDVGMLEQHLNRARWLERHILPHEEALRAWLHKKTTVGLDVDDIVQETYAILASLDSVENIQYPKTYAVKVAVSVILGSRAGCELGC